jgi:TPR repeat protein
MYHQKDAAQLKQSFLSEPSLPQEQVDALNNLMGRISKMDNIAESLAAQFADPTMAVDKTLEIENSTGHSASELRNIIHTFKQTDTNVIRPEFKKTRVVEQVNVHHQAPVVNVEVRNPIAQHTAIGISAKQLESEVFPDHFKEMANKLANMQNVVLTRSYLALVVDIQNQLESLCEAIENGRSEEKLRDQSSELRIRMKQASKNFPACAEPLAQSLSILDELTMKLNSFGQISYGVADASVNSERDSQFSSAIASQTSKPTPTPLKAEPRVYDEPVVAARIVDIPKAENKPSTNVLKELYKITSPFMPSARQTAFAIIAVLVAFPAYQIFNSAKSGLTNMFFGSNASSKLAKFGGDAFATSAIATQKPITISTNTPVSNIKTVRNLDVPVIPQGLSSPTIVSAIASGDAAAMYELGMKLREGRGVERDAAAALNWFKAGAELGNIPSTIRYAKMLEKGEGGIKDLSGAMSFYQRAADKGSREATHALAALFASGSNGNADFKQAFTLFDRAARAGYVDSQYNLGVLYAAGQGVKPNLAESYKWFSIAAQGGDKNAATSRDEIARQLDPQTLATAKAQLRKINLAAPAGDVTLPPRVDLAPRVDVVEE